MRLDFIDKLLAKKGVTIVQAVKDTKVSRQTWYNIKEGKGKLHYLTIAKLINYFGLTFEEFEEEYNKLITELQTKKE